MRVKSWWIKYLILAVTAIFVGCVVFESVSWARAGGGGSAGSRGSRSFSTPQRPSSPGPSSPGPGQQPGDPYSQQRPDMSSPSSGFFSRSPFMQGLAGGLLGGFVGNMLFGGSGQASAPGATGGGGIGLMDIILIGALLYFLMKYLKRRREQASGTASSYQSATRDSIPASDYGLPARQSIPDIGRPAAEQDLEKGLQQIRLFDQNFDIDAFKETVQDIFFRIQAAWMNRSPDGTEKILTEEMANYMAGEFALMKQKGQINRLENIAVRKVEIAEAWQEAGKEYITVLFTANLLDYSVDEKSGEVVAGDRRNPVKFEEFWTFCRPIGERNWALSAIQQVK
jgi:predicted lipid-binding transport protein (Tim44 family)